MNHELAERSPQSLAEAAIPHADEPLWFDTCHFCDYSLEGSPPVGQCPECGRLYDRRRFELSAWLTASEGGIAAGRSTWKTYAVSAVLLLMIAPQLLVTRQSYRPAVIGLLLVGSVVIPLWQRSQRWSRSPFILIANERGVARLDAKPVASDWFQRHPTLVRGGIMLVIMTFLFASLTRGNTTFAWERAMPFVMLTLMFGGMLFGRWRVLRRMKHEWQRVLPGQSRRMTEKAVSWPEFASKLDCLKDGTIRITVGKREFFNTGRLRLIVEGDAAFAGQVAEEFERLRRAAILPAVTAASISGAVSSTVAAS